MPRLHFDQLSARPDGFVELLIPRPAVVPAGYTAMMLVSEWLTLNCRADWACRTNAKALRIRFADPADRDRAAARFLAGDVVSLANRPPTRRPNAPPRRRRAVA